jgi:hypothetical protein
MISLYELMESSGILYDGDKFIKTFRKRDTPVLNYEKYPNAKIQDIKMEWGKWFEWGYFRVRFYKKGTCHFEFLNQDIWAKFNQHVGRIKGYPLPESVKTEKKKYYNQPKTSTPKRKPIIIESITL